MTKQVICSANRHFTYLSLMVLLLCSRHVLLPAIFHFLFQKLFLDPWFSCIDDRLETLQKLIGDLLGSPTRLSFDSSEKCCSLCLHPSSIALHSPVALYMWLYTLDFVWLWRGSPFYLFSLYIFMSLFHYALIFSVVSLGNGILVKSDPTMILGIQALRSSLGIPLVIRFRLDRLDLSSFSLSPPNEGRAVG